MFIGICKAGHVQCKTNVKGPWIQIELGSELHSSRGKTCRMLTKVSRSSTILSHSLVA
jgi:hypothetical protein